MFNVKSNVLKKSKRQYTNILKKTDMSSYLLHEKMSTGLNRSSISSALDTTSSRSNMTKSHINSTRKLPFNDNEKNLYKFKKCSYTDFLALRNKKISAPFNYTDTRFKWQNLKDEHVPIDPSICTKPHKKKFLLKETFGEGILGFLNKEKIPENRSRIKRYRQYNTDSQGFIQNVDIDISRRVVNPEYNKEASYDKKYKRSLSQTNFILHRTNGNLFSLFNLTPMNYELKGNKKLYPNKSYAVKTINIFSDKFAKYEMPTHTKKLFFDNRCYFDTLKHDDLVIKIDDCWKSSEEIGKKGRRSWSFDEKCLTKKDYLLQRDRSILSLRKNNFDYMLFNKWNNNRSVGKIKRK